MTERASRSIDVPHPADRRSPTPAGAAALPSRDGPETVLWLFANPLAPGGTAAHFGRLAATLDAADWRVIAVAPNFDQPEIRRYFEGSPAELVTIPRLGRAPIDAAGVLTLRRLMKSRGISILHSVHVKSDVLGTIAAALAGVRHQVSSLEVYYIAPGGPKAWIYKTAFRAFVGGRIERFIALSPQSKREFLEQVSYDPQRVVVIPLGIDIGGQQLQPRTPNGNPVVFGALGRFIPEKGFDLLIDAFRKVESRLPSAQLMIAGSGPQEASLRERAARCGLNGSVQFVGWAERVERFLEPVDVVVFPSRARFDGLPHVVLEAMLHSRPVVATDVGGVRSVVDDGLTGLLVKPNDPSALAEAMMRAATQPAARLARASAAKARIVTEHSRELEASRLSALYREMLGKAGPP
jgi:glycosyltransferase involved in cell wall biosynthesis